MVLFVAALELLHACLPCHSRTLCAASFATRPRDALACMTRACQQPAISSSPLQPTRIAPPTRARSSYRVARADPSRHCSCPRLVSRATPRHGAFRACTHTTHTHTRTNLYHAKLSSNTITSSISSPFPSGFSNRHYRKTDICRVPGYLPSA